VFYIFSKCLYFHEATIFVIQLLEILWSISSGPFSPEIHIFSFTRIYGDSYKVKKPRFLKKTNPVVFVGFFAGFFISMCSARCYSHQMNV